jgi:hypothetical protein
MNQKRRSNEEWSEVLAAYQGRKCTQEEFCQMHNVNPNSLSYQLSKISKQSSFVPAVREEVRLTKICLELPQGIKLTIGS